MFKVRWMYDGNEDKPQQARTQARMTRELRAAGMRQVGVDDQGFELWEQDPDYRPTKARLRSLFTKWPKVGFMRSNDNS